MELLLVIGLIAVLIYIFQRKPKGERSPAVSEQLSQRNYEWAQFIANYYTQTATQEEKYLIERMLADIAAKGLPVPRIEHAQSEQQAIAPTAAEYTATTPTPVAIHAYQTEPPAAALPTPGVQPSQNKALDNTSLLLYFGAFLFVASAGLFVTFGGLSGGLRTLIVLLVSGIFYFGGLWIFDHKSSLKQAALTFVGIGMTTAPLTGLAAYNYLFDQTGGSFVWFATSLICALMYGHALIKLREPLISYIFIFTFLSLFESGISLISAPIYYFGWAMAVVGIGLSAYSRYGRPILALEEPSRSSAKLFVPLAVLVSLVLIPDHGAAQLGVSLLVAATYYLLEALASRGSVRLHNAAATQVATVVGIGALSYAVTDSLTSTTATVTVLSLLQASGLLARSAESTLWRNTATIIIGLQITAALLAYDEPGAVLFALSGLTASAGLIAWRQHRADAYAVAALSLMAVPLVYGYLYAEPALRTNAVVGLLLIALFVVGLAHTVIARRTTSDSNWRQTLPTIYIIASLVPIVTSFWSSNWGSVITCGIVALTMLYLAYNDRNPSWATAAGLAVSTPLIFGLFEPLEPRTFLVATILALGLNLYAALWQRQEANRWFSTFLWLLLPSALGSGALTSPWNATEYAWAYTAVLIVLVASRAIALARPSAVSRHSIAYVVGYVWAGMLALIVSLFAVNSQLHTSLILGVVITVTYVLTEFIEKRADGFVILPIFVQLLLLSSWRSADTAAQMVPFLITSSTLAAIGYFASRAISTVPEKQQALRDGSLFAAFMTPAAGLFSYIWTATYWPMPYGMILAGGLVLDRVWRSAQENKELAGGLILLGVFWAMNFHGVENFQAYTHVLVALLGIYAYWRHYRGETTQSDQYLWAALAVSTIPLGLQALSGDAGGLYGWWLLLEQIGWMLVGIVIGKRFVTMWGLYVSVGAVLYQLRDLGWAALTLLAVFLIGIAIYRLQKTKS